MAARKSIRRTRAISSAVLALAGGLGFATSSQAAPLVTLSILGKDMGPSHIDSNFSSSLSSVAVGDTISYEIVMQMASIGTTNSNNGGTTIASLTDGVDGVNSLDFDLFQLTGDGIQTNFTLTSPPDAVTLDAAWHAGFGSSGGIQADRTNGNNDLVTIRPARQAGTFAGVSPSSELIGTGTAVVTSASAGGASFLRFLWDFNGSGGFRINGASQAPLFMNHSTEYGNDPYVGFVPLTLPAPEPGTLSLLGIGAASLLLRRSKQARL